MADVSITPGNVVMVNGTRINGRVAGGTITAGMAVRIQSSDGRLIAALSDSAVNAAVDGIALNGASANQPLEYAGDGAVVNIGGTLVVGHAYYLGTANGAIKPASDVAGTEFATVVGIAQTTANLLIKVVRAGAIAGAAIT